MTTYVVLAGLIDQNHVARETYYLRKREELSPSKSGLTAAGQRELTQTAAVAWKTAEVALWRYRATH